MISSVSYYHLTKQNISVPIAGTQFSQAIGEARSQGVEIDVSGQITNSLKLIASYAYTDAVILKAKMQEIAYGMSPEMRAVFGLTMIFKSMESEV